MKLLIVRKFLIETTIKIHVYCLYLGERGNGELGFTFDLNDSLAELVSESVCSPREEAEQTIDAFCQINTFEGSILGVYP